MELRSTVKRLVEKSGYQVSRAERPDYVLPADQETISAVRPFTLTSRARVLALCDAVRYVDRYGIAGSIVECGVWKGGSAMAAARTLIDVGDTARDLYLYDTFSGMTEPTDKDVEIHGVSAAERLAGGATAFSPLDEVQANMAATGYPAERIHYVQGKVEDTIPGTVPERIAVLRLDTDWYESTKHEIDHLADLVSPNGVLIVDDYGHWDGCRRAVDEWISARKSPVLLSRIDYTGRMAVLA